MHARSNVAGGDGGRGGTEHVAQRVDSLLGVRRTHQKVALIQGMGVVWTTDTHSTGGAAQGTT